MFCQAQVVSEKWPAIVEAVATTALVVVATVQWFAMRTNNEMLAEQSKLERDRWQREDEIRAEANKPKATFLLNRNGEHYVKLSCTNLGTVNFIVNKITIKSLQGAQAHDIPIDNQSRSVVLVGSEWNVDLASSKFNGLNGNYGVSLTLEGASGEVITGENACYILVFHGKCMSLSQGYSPCGLPSDLSAHKRELIDCPKCNANVAYFNVDDMPSVAECRKEIASVLKEFEATCPTHTSNNCRITIFSAPPTDASRNDG